MPGRLNPAHIFLFALFYLLPACIWQTINYRETGYSGFSSVSGYTIYFYNSAAVLSYIDNIPFEEMQKQMGYFDEKVYFNKHPEQKNWSKTQIYKYFDKKGKEIIFRHPLVYAKIHLKGTLQGLLDTGAVDMLKILNMYRQNSGNRAYMANHGVILTVIKLYKDNPASIYLSLIFGIIHLFIIVCFIAAFFAGRSSNTYHEFFIWTSILYLIVLAGGPQFSGRFVLPALPLICVYSGYGFAVSIKSFSLKILNYFKH
jgi:hypothetical protein